MNQMPIVVITTYLDNQCMDRVQGDIRTFKDASAARAWIDEEILWEDTIQCRCPSLGIDVAGTFAHTHE